MNAGISAGWYFTIFANGQSLGVFTRVFTTTKIFNSPYSLGGMFTPIRPEIQRQEQRMSLRGL